MSTDMRKYQRYKSKVPIRFSNKFTEGIMLDASREGALIVMETNQQKSIGSFITFRAFLDGIKPPKEKTTPSIRTDKIFGKSSEIKPKSNKNKMHIKISAKVVRHCEYKGRNAMGLQFMDMDVDDLMSWLSFIGDIKTKQEILPFGTSSSNNRRSNADIKKVPGFTIRFQDTVYLKDFLPDEPTGSFFIPTKKSQKKDGKVRLTLVHPKQDKCLQIETTVSSNFTNELDQTKRGLLCNFSQVTEELIKKINNFLDEKYYAA